MDIQRASEQSPLPVQYLIQMLRHGSLRPPTATDDRARLRELQEARIKALLERQQLGTAGAPQAQQSSSERAITQYAGDSPLQRRMREAGLE